MSDNAIHLNFFDENGELKPFEEFSSELKEIYKELEKSTASAFIRYLSCPKNEFDPTALLEKFQFLDRKLYLDSEITDEIGKEFLEQIQLWNAEDDYNGLPIESRIPIQIFINSPGGDLITTFQIIDAIQCSRTPVHTIVTGSAYSGGFFIGIAGHKRYAFPHASFMFHEGSNLNYGDAHKVIQQTEFYETLLKQLKTHVLKSTTISAAVYEEHKKDDWYFTAKKALKYGVIDVICDNVNGGIENEE